MQKNSVLHLAWLEFTNNTCYLIFRLQHIVDIRCWKKVRESAVFCIDVKR